MIYGFNTNEIPQLSDVGGKAKSLIEITKAGFNVPEGFVLSVEFFAPWIQEIKATAVWKKFLETPAKEQCDELKKLAGRLEFTSAQRDTLENALKGLSEYLTFAVRSSSPEEDLKNISFAGIYETRLGVTNENLKKAITEVFISMLDIRVVEYKRLNNISVDNPRIAVIVQRQISSEISGIAFSLNPQNNCYDEAFINASFGLGETIVSGQVTPDNYVVEKVKKEILEKNVTEKVRALWLDKKGGTTGKDNENPKAQALTDEQILMVTKLVTKCEQYYQRPIDIEWAIADGKLYLLQARPITTYFPLFSEMLTKPGKEKHLYIDIIVLSQGFSESLSVLGQEIFSKMIVMAKMGLMPEGKDGIIFNVHGRMYMHISNILKGLGEKRVRKTIATYDNPTRKIFESIDLKQEYMPAVKTEKMKQMTKSTIKMGFSVGPVLLKSFFNYKKILNNYKKNNEEIYRYCKKELTCDKYFDELVDEGLGAFAKMVKSALALIAAMYANLRLTKMFKNKNADDLLIALSMDLPGNPTSEMGYHMLKLAAYEEIQNTTSKEEFLQKLNEKQYSEAFLNDFEDYMEKFGARCFKEVDIAAPRPYEHPEEFFNQLKHMNIHDNAMTTVRARKDKAYNELLEIAKKAGKKKKFIKYARIYNDLMGYREHPKYIYVVVNDMLRRRALQLGEKFMAQGRLESVEQIFDLTIKQITEAEKNPKLALLPIIEKNLAPRKLVEKVREWPKIVDSRGKIFRYIRESEDGDLIGDAIAPGVVRGKAKILHSPYEKPLEKGEILIARATEPAWTPIFVNAVGVILEIGGPLQHGAIIAREYGIPCVSGVDRATEVIKDGDLLEVDGSSGLVKIIK